MRLGILFGLIVVLALTATISASDFFARPWTGETVAAASSTTGLVAKFHPASKASTVSLVTVDAEV